jgi:hypothetical protein
MNRPTISLNDAWVYLKASVAGFLITTSIYFGVAFSRPVNQYVPYLPSPAQKIIVFALILFVLLTYAWFRGAFQQAIKIGKSKRIDLLITFALGCAINRVLTPELNKLYASALRHVQPRYVLIIVGLPLFFFAVTTLDTAFRELVKLKRRTGSPMFMNDMELKSIGSDLLGNSDAAARFAAQIWNGGAADSLVFGLDAPWGIGKSSFINFTVEHLAKLGGANAITFKFNPLKYHDKTKLLEKLIDGLREEITASLFVPELATLLATYSKLISGKFGLTFFGVRLDSTETSVDAAYNELERSLARLNRKILVVIDDLDRIDYAEVKEILFTIKKSFMLPNVSYVLSYDTENILALDKDSSDSEKVREFMEKFVNIKASLFLDSSKLVSYVTTNFNEACKQNLLHDPVTVAKTAGALGELGKIFESTEFHRYYPAIGDIRKLKRLINTILSLEIEKTEFESSDFDKSDLLHLLLIYLNYPHIFRVIYNTETNGRDGFFSAVGKLHPWYPPSKSGESSPSGWQNSTKYHEYVEELTPLQRLLVEKIFSMPSRLSRTSTEISEQRQATLACFNQKGNSRNLERYLNLIVKTAKPVEHSQYNFYVAKYKKVLTDQNFTAVFKDPRFDLSNGEYTHRYFWRVFVNQAQALKLRETERAIEYLVEQIPTYSTLELKNLDLGLRNSLPIYLLKLLNDAGWEDKNGEHVDNATVNILRIAHHIFGDQSYSKNGIITRLMKEQRGALGVYDVLIFRLYCCASRDTDLFNLHRALVKYGDPKGITEGSVSLITIGEMRELSQKIARDFLDRYQNENRCVLKEIDDLSIDDLCGDTSTYIKEKITAAIIKQESVDSAANIARSRIKTFITYQLGAIDASGGITCGYYDISGNKDSSSISVLVNDYLFDVCFNPAVQPHAYETFLDFLMISYPDAPNWSGNEPRPSLQSFTRVLYTKSLSNYWSKHGGAIRLRNFDLKDKTIQTVNYTLNYTEHLNDVFALLDTLPTQT